MLCPNCNKTIDISKLSLSGCYLASDYSYCTAEGFCPHCYEDLELYYVLKEVNGEAI